MPKLCRQGQTLLHPLLCSTCSPHLLLLSRDLAKTQIPSSAALVSPSHVTACPLALSSVHGAVGCCPSTVLFHGGSGCCDVTLVNELHPLLSSTGKAVPTQGASLAGASSSEGHPSASSSHPFALPRGISHSPALSCLGYESGTSTASVPPPQSIRSSHSQTSTVCTEELGAQPVVAQSHLKAGLYLFAPGKCIPTSSCCSDLQECSCWEQCNLTACPHDGREDTCDAPQCFVTPALLPKQPPGNTFEILSLQVMSHLIQQPASPHSQPTVVLWDNWICFGISDGGWLSSPPHQATSYKVGRKGLAHSSQLHANPREPFSDNSCGFSARQQVTGQRETASGSATGGLDWMLGKTS